MLKFNFVDVFLLLFRW